jgi:hypothetical protein
LWLSAALLCVIVLIITWMKTRALDIKYVGAGVFCLALAWYASRRTRKP